MLTTEQTNPLTAEIDRMPTLDALCIINAEDRKVAEAVAEALPSVARAVEAVAERLARGGRLIYVGAGTSGRLGILDASECPPTFGIPPDMVQGVIAGGYEACYRAVEASEDDRAAGAEDMRARNVTALDAVAGIAASGRTPYTIGAVEYARRQGALTLCVTCNRGSELAAAAEIPIEAVVGPEVIAGSTRLKSGTAQKLVLNMLSTMTMVRLGYVAGNRMSNLTPRNTKLRERAAGIIGNECNLDETSSRELLERAGWDVPTAIVMHRTGAERSKAQAAIAQSHGVIARAVEMLSAKGEESAECGEEESAEC